MTDPRVTNASDTRPPLTDEERDLVRLEVDGPIAVITNNRPSKHNAMSDEMDRRLWEVLAEVHEMPDLRAIVWRGEGKSFSSGRDTGQIGVRVEDISDLEFIERGHRPSHADWNTIAAEMRWKINYTRAFTQGERDEYMALFNELRHRYE